MTNKVEKFHKKPPLVLASSSPRRHKIFEQLGFNFIAVSVDVDESALSGAKPEIHSIETAKKKAIAAVESRPDAIIVAADTIVVLGDGAILGKPENEVDAKRMLGLLQGEKHTVITALALITPEKQDIFAAYDRADVTFLPMDSAEIDWYVATGEPLDKAGAYGMQGKGMFFIQKVCGSPSTVIGLPVHILYQLFKTAGIEISEYLINQWQTESD